MRTPVASKKQKRRTPAEAARIAAGYSLGEAAKRLRLHPRYLHHLERNGGASLPLARKMAALFACDGNVFLYSPEYMALLGQRAALPVCTMPSATAGADASTPRASRRYRPPEQPVLTLLKGGI